jgi:hypothetical protein
LDYLLTGIMFILFSWDLKLAAMNMKESGNWLAAVLCDAGGDFAGVVALCSLSEGFSGIANWVKDKTNRMKPNKKGFVRIGGWNDDNSIKNVYKSRIPQITRKVLLMYIRQPKTM